MFEYAHKRELYVCVGPYKYHHLDLFAGHQQYFVFSFQFKGQIAIFFFTVLMFGLHTGPHIFTKHVVLKLPHLSVRESQLSVPRRCSGNLYMSLMFLFIDLVFLFYMRVCMRFND